MSTTQDRVNTVPYVFVPFFYGVIVSCQFDTHTHKQLIAWLHRPSKRLLSYYWHIDLRCTTSVYRDCRKTTLLNKKNVYIWFSLSETFIKLHRGYITMVLVANVQGFYRDFIGYGFLKFLRCGAFWLLS